MSDDTDLDTDLDIVRRAYAKQIMANFGVVDRRVEAAFASSQTRALPRPRPVAGHTLGTRLCADTQPRACVPLR
jgi:hypothetical protein